MDMSDKIREIAERGYCVLHRHFQGRIVAACRDSFWPFLLVHLATPGHEPNRGARRHFLPMPFDPPCFAPEFFFDQNVLSVVRGVMGDRVVADQWGCDVALGGSEFQEVHVDYRRPLFEETPDLLLPPYILVVSFGLARIGPEDGPIEIAPGTHRMPRAEAMQAVQSGAIGMQPIVLEVGDVLIRHPWALHRGSPNSTGTPRALASIRYVRRWYVDDSREVNSIGRAVWLALAPEQRSGMRFPVANSDS